MSFLNQQSGKWLFYKVNSQRNSGTLIAVSFMKSQPCDMISPKSESLNYLIIDALSTANSNLNIGKTSHETSPKNITEKLS